MSSNDLSTEKKKSNARLALFIALIPVVLFVASFFIQR